MSSSNLRKTRNVAVIAHVDHGKTTLMNRLMHASGVLGDQESALMDSMDLEKERGITISSKTTTLYWKDYQFNMVDTPGHADFGGEVERILSMVDGVLLLVDASEGVMPQTKFVLTKALNQGLHPIVVINKMDKPDERAEGVIDEILSLFSDLGANEEQSDFPLIYASSQAGWAILERDDPKENMIPLLDTIIDYVPAPQGNPEAPFQMLVTTIDVAPFLGRVLTGRIHEGTIKENMYVQAINLDGKIIEQGRITKIFVKKGFDPLCLPQAQAGDIVSIAGLSKATVTDTVADPVCSSFIPANTIDPPTLTMKFSVNDSPFAGRDGNKLTSRMLRDRLLKELERNVSIQVSESPEGEGFQVSGRGELQLAILIETMRREGFELSVSRPQVLFKQDEKGKRLEPIEEVQIDVDAAYPSAIIEILGKRHGKVLDMKNFHGKQVRMQLECPTRALIGFNSELLKSTRGSGVMCRSFKGYERYKGDISSSRNGVLISLEQGKVPAYSLMNIESRGTLFIKPGEEVYKGMIIGEHNTTKDLSVNPLKGKKLTNMRASGSDREIKLAPPRIITLDTALSYIEPGEKLEITPIHIRLRKVKINKS